MITEINDERTVHINFFFFFLLRLYYISQIVIYSVDDQILVALKYFLFAIIIYPDLV